MSRPRTTRPDLPPRLHARVLKKRTLYYYRAGGKAIPLGPDLAQAKRRWAELETAGAPDTDHSFTAVTRRFECEGMRNLAPKTIREYRAALDTLRAAFKPFQLEQIEPRHVAEYIVRRSRPIAANREVALLSRIWNWARSAGVTRLANPATGVDRNPAKHRGRYVTDTEYTALLAHAPQWLRDAMELAITTGQRPGDILRMTRHDLQDGHLWVRQSKTGAKLGIEITGRLARVIADITARPITAMHLVHDAGQPVSIYRLDKAFATARRAAGADWQFRDLRAKTITDTPDLRTASQRAGHSNETITAAVYRRVRGHRVKPLD